MTTTTTEQILVSKYGPLLTLAQVSELLNRSADGLRMSLRGDSLFARRMQSARRKIGRRLYFKAVDLAKIIDDEA